MLIFFKYAQIFPYLIKYEAYQMEKMGWHSRRMSGHVDIPSFWI
jgi:hypothetical protein